MLKNLLENHSLEIARALYQSSYNPNTLNIQKVAIGSGVSSEFGNEREEPVKSSVWDFRRHEAN